MARPLRGLETEHEQKPQELLRDTRTLLQRFMGVIRNPQSGTLLIATGAIAIIFLPQIADIILPLACIIFLTGIMNKQTLPYRMPQRANALDYNDLAPGSGKPVKSRGIFYLGNDIKSNQELWFNNEDMRTHMLIFGSTGSGKTETLVSLSYNALLQGSGFIYIDGKGDNNLYAKVFSMARAMGREDDLLLINFMTGARDINGPQKSRISNTMNPFSRGSSSMLSQLVVSMMDSAAATPDGDMWKGRAISFVEALMKILVYMRDRGDILLDANVIRKYFVLPKIESMAVDKKFPLEDGRMISISDAPEVVIEPIQNFLDTLPGYDKSKKGKQSSETLEQHGFVTMQLTRVFSSLADTYGHIIRTNLAEVDFKDVVLNRRILVVLLPALEKSPEELSALGKVIVASLKAMMAAGLGEEVEGTYQQLIERKPTNSPTPFICILDEYGYYAVPGFAVVPAQARSLGFSAVFAGQDLPAFEKASKEEAQSIGANTNIKICMKLEDPTTTWEFFQKTAGQAYVSFTSGFQTNANSMTNSYLDTKNAQTEKRDRIDLLDLKDQGVGEAHVFFKSKIIRARMFYANPPINKNMRLNQQLKIDKPSELYISTLEKRFESFDNVLSDPSCFAPDVKLDEELHLIREHLNAQIDSEKSLFEQSIIAFVQYYIHESKPPEEEMPIFFEDNIESEQDNVFTGMDIFTQPNPQTQEDEDGNFDPLNLLNAPALMGALLDARQAKQNMEHVERFAGKTKAEASAAADKLIREVRAATQYPPEDVTVTRQKTSSILEAVDTIINHLEEAKAKAEEKKK